MPTVIAILYQKGGSSKTTIATNLAHALKRDSYTVLIPLTNCLERCYPPFRFNPKVPREEQAKRYFVQLKAKFNPEKNIFIFDSLMGLPTEELPNFLKASKIDKATVAAEKRKSNPNKKPGAKNESNTPLPKHECFVYGTTSSHPKSQ